MSLSKVKHIYGARILREKIGKVLVKGQEGDERVFVEVERAVFAGRNESIMLMTEKRYLAFFRALEPEQAKDNLRKEDRVLTSKLCVY